MQLEVGDTLFREGDEARGVYVLQSGQVDLLFCSRKGEAKPLRVAQAGQILGLSCVVTQRPHDCSATAATPCKVGFIDSGAFQRVLTECPAVWFSVLRLLSSDVNAVYEDIRALAAR
jgi:CRP-like cAMP-binding protein